MTRNPKLATIVILGTILFSFVDSKPRADIRFFCSHERVFIEFEENGKVWGTIWIDDDGKPLSCSDSSIPKTKASSMIKDI
jgi:hypothetical protein